MAFGELVERYEFVEVLAPGRRRGDELKADRSLSPEDRGKAFQVPQDQWTPARDVLAEVSARVAAKAGKSYPAGTILVVYLNVWPVAGTAELERGLASAVAPAHGAFKSLWVLDNGRVREFAGR
ncbi:MAG: hypothetical protein E7812_00340 [Phenylobacterium sp.]|nr:MAG: hypothetical protein E7812_00340 [Phenylobacterium sp.]